MLQAQRVRPLCKTLAMLVAQQITVVPGGRFVAERSLQQDLARCGAQQIGATNNFGDLHGGVVNHDCELIGGHIVTAPDEEVSKIAASRKALIAKVEIGERDLIAIRDIKAPIHAGGSFVLLRFRHAMAAPAGVDGLIVGIVGSTGRFGQFFTRAGAGINVSAIAKPAPRVEIKLVALALRIRSEGAAHVWSFLPRDSQPVKIFDEGVYVLRLGALRIEVLVTQDERSVGVDGSLIGSPEGGCVTKVEQAGGRGREAAAISRCVVQLRQIRILLAVVAKSVRHQKQMVVQVCKDLRSGNTE